MKPLHLVSVILLALSFDIKANTTETKNIIDIYIAPSAAELNWTTPRTLFETVKRSQSISSGYQTDFGHGMFVSDCTNMKGESFKVSSSMGGYNYSRNTRNSIVFKRDGLRVLFKDLTKGYLVDTITNNTFLHNMYRYENTLSGKPEKHFSKLLRINVTPEKCSMVQDFFTTFKNSKSLKFGFEKDPYKQYLNQENDLGAGCTSFVAGIIKVLGVWDQSLEENFMTRIEMSTDWIGEKKKNVNLFKKIKSNDGERWVTPGSETVLFNFYDPEKMWDFLDSATSCLSPDREKFVNGCNANAAKWVKEVSAKFTMTKTKDESRKFYGVELRAD